jgi:NAD(P)-dependent dehydrogenase (short-subunit alcohol dehydrogenase family)
VTQDRPVVVVTGGGGGIGAAVAEELGRQGAHVVTIDPLVSLDGSELLPAPEETTAGRIVAAGGSAEASSASVTDADAVRRVFEELVAAHGRLDAVVNVAGISRPTSFAAGREEDWRSVLEVHLDGYLNVLAAALPLMASAGRGRILGVTSGSGWRAADTGAYGCAKRAVASLTWQLGADPPAGVTVNAMSPIAVTRMVTAALGRAPAAGAQGAARATGGLSLGSMPEPGDLGPLGAYLASEQLGWCSGEIVFVGGSELAIVDRPRLLELVRTDGVGSLDHLLDEVGPGALARAEAAQASGGGTNPRFGSAFAAAGGALAGPALRSCAVISDRPALAKAVDAALEARGIATRSRPATTAPPDGVAEVDAVVVAMAEPAPSSAGSSWERTLEEHLGLAGRIQADAAWARAASDAGRPIRLVTVVDAATAGGRSRAQSAAHHSRASRRATEDRVAAFAISDEGGDPTATGALAAHLVGHPDAPALSGAELVVGRGWLGLRSHPRPTGSIVLGEPTVPDWLDGALRSIVGARPGPTGEAAG